VHHLAPEEVMVRNALILCLFAAVGCSGGPRASIDAIMLDGTIKTAAHADGDRVMLIAGFGATLTELATSPIDGSGRFALSVSDLTAKVWPFHDSFFPLDGNGTCTFPADMPSDLQKVHVILALETASGELRVINDPVDFLVVDRDADVKGDLKCSRFPDGYVAHYDLQLAKGVNAIGVSHQDGGGHPSSNPTYLSTPVPTHLTLDATEPTPPMP
jgi:hypothetical protein